MAWVQIFAYKTCFHLDKDAVEQKMNRKKEKKKKIEYHKIKIFSSSFFNLKNVEPCYSLFLEICCNFHRKNICGSYLSSA